MADLEIVDGVCIAPRNSPSLYGIWHAAAELRLSAQTLKSLATGAAGEVRRKESYRSRKKILKKRC